MYECENCTLNQIKRDQGKLSQLKMKNVQIFITQKKIQLSFFNLISGKNKTVCHSMLTETTHFNENSHVKKQFGK